MIGKFSINSRQKPLDGSSKFQVRLDQKEENAVNTKQRQLLDELIYLLYQLRLVVEDKEAKSLTTPLKDTSVSRDNLQYNQLHANSE